MTRPVVLVIGPLPPPAGGVGVLVESILRSPLSHSWTLRVFNLSKPQQEGRPSTVTAWDVVWTLWHLIALPLRILRERPAVALVQSTADTGFVRDLALILECRALGVPVVVQWHGAPESPQFPGQARWRRGLFRFGARLAQRVIVLAEPYREAFAHQVPAERLAVVPNFTDGAAFAPSAERNGSAPVTVLFVGRIGPQKGVDVLLQALTRARTAAPGLRAVLLGAGESAEAWRAVSQDPLVASGVAELRGPAGRERAHAYRAADIFVLPTRADSFPIAIVEAMAAGLPVVASDVGAVSWILEGGRCGRLVPAGEVESLARALVELANDREMRLELGRRARARQALCFDASSVARSLDAILREAIDRPDLSRTPSA